MAVVAVAASPPAGVAPAFPDVSPLFSLADTGKLRWRPPTQTSPTIITMGSGNYSFDFGASEDVILLASASTVRTGHISVTGGRHLRIIGGKVNYTEPSSGAQTSCVRCKGWSASIFLEGLHLDLSAKPTNRVKHGEVDAFNPCGSTASPYSLFPDVYIQNCLVAGMHGSNTAWGYVEFAGLPSNGDTMTLRGQVWTFTTAASTGTGIQIKADVALTIAEAVARLNANSTFINATLGATARASTHQPTRLFIDSKQSNEAGQVFTLAVSGANLARSFTTLWGGNHADWLQFNGSIGRLFTDRNTIWSDYQGIIFNTTLRDEAEISRHDWRGIHPCETGKDLTSYAQYQVGGSDPSVAISTKVQDYYITPANPARPKASQLVKPNSSEGLGLTGIQVPYPPNVVADGSCFWTEDKGLLFEGIFRQGPPPAPYTDGYVQAANVGLGYHVGHPAAIASPLEADMVARYDRFADGVT